MKFKKKISICLETLSGTKIWRTKDGLYHKDNGPAVIYPNGDKIWYKYGKLHREDGPAIEYANGSKEWYLDGKKYSEEEYNKECDFNFIYKNTLRKIAIGI